MSTSVQHLIETFEELPEDEKQELAIEIIKRTVNFDIPPLTDEELILNAENIFLELDKRES
jgi:hypothetical protein